MDEKTNSTRICHNYNKANKSCPVVIVTVKDYKIEVERRLRNTDNYRKLQEDPTATNMKLVNDTTEIQKTKIDK